MKYVLPLVWGSLLLASVAFTKQVAASEGLWLPSEQPDLSNNLPTQAVVKIGTCSGVLVSSQGLLLTNAHCIEDTLEVSSDVESEIKASGFIAQSQDQELVSAPGLFASITLEQSDVTEAMSVGVTADMTPRERFLKITRNRNQLITECENEATIKCQVQSHQDGLSYLLIKEREYRDVRLVYVPPVSLTMHGGEDMNWQWPRFSADIAILRVYTDTEGKAADYSEENIPLEPPQYAEVGDSHLTFFDTVRVAGFPGQTQRLRTASEVQWNFTENYPALLSYLHDFEAMVEAQMETSERARIRFQPVYFQLSNHITFIESQIEYYQRFGVQRLSENRQGQLLQWLSAPEREPMFREAWWTVQEQLQSDRTWLEQDLWWNFLNRLSLPGAALLVHRYAYEQTLPADIRSRGFQQRDLPALQARLDQYAHRLWPEFEQRLMVYLMNRYLELPEAQQIASVNDFFGIDENTTEESLQNRIEELYAAPGLLEDEVREAWLGKSLNEVQQSDDPWLQFATQTSRARLQMDSREIERRGRMAYARPMLMNAQLELEGTYGRQVPANANRTLRVSEGQVLGYNPSPNKDPNEYKLALTYLDVFRDHIQENNETNVPEQFVGMMRRHNNECFINFERESVPVNFISTADSTPGSSGSPTFDQEGRLIGLVYDLMEESTISDWHYSREHHRTIHVDIRYVLWILGYYEGADTILRELGFSHQGDAETPSCRLTALNF
ncbi:MULTISPECIES: S46 family peptidase [Gammaproteobacteria]|uniref:S46 family peptidase n=1 Tax=Gammaproteobacteria TaxID=1236 RepID=UPI000DCFD1F1|nr:MULTISPECIES: S46 family peptidase [Gammaproteobacteria]RTE86547.1 trypsin-like serine protease [Aliidiomarina sp. B3213]TCZ90898.1 trypsin-like serine protease [Lysobacter sp. N42]